MREGNFLPVAVPLGLLAGSGLGPGKAPGLHGSLYVLQTLFVSFYASNADSWPYGGSHTTDCRIRGVSSYLLEKREGFFAASAGRAWCFRCS